MPHVSLIHWQAWVRYQEQLALAERQRERVWGRDEQDGETKAPWLRWQIRAALVRGYEWLGGARAGSAVPPAAEV